MTTAYNPASNGETERFNRTMTTMLRKELEDGQHGNWENMLGDVCFAYRASVNSSTSETPYYLLHGRDPNVPINQFLDAVSEPVPSSFDYIGSLVDRLRFSFQRTRDENEKARERQREQYNKRAKLYNYKIGDRVLLDIRVVEKGNNRKFTSKFQGPFRVIRVYPNRTADITDNTYKIKTVHVNRLKPLYETMLWKDEHLPEMLPTFEGRDHFHKNMSTQTGVDEEPDSLSVESEHESRATSPIRFGNDVSNTAEPLLDLFPPFEAIEILNEPNQITPGPPVSIETHADIFETAPDPNPLPLPIEIDRVFRPVSPPIFQAILQNVNEPPRVPHEQSNVNLRPKRSTRMPTRFDDYFVEKQ